MKMIGLHNTFLQQSLSLVFPLLASTHRLAFKTQIAHWNVEGQMFFQLHEAFGSQYDDMADAVDVIAEHIRALGSKPDPRLSYWLESSIVSDNEVLTSELDYVEDLLESHAKITEYIRDSITTMGDSPDESTRDLLIERLRYHEKIIWMLRSYVS
jgi:starvation-inducible DNA-binding protein